MAEEATTTPAGAGNRRSFSQVVKTNQQEEIAFMPGPLMDRLMASVKNTVTFDAYPSNAQEKMKGSLYGKFLGRPPPLEVVRENLSKLWETWGDVTVADMANGFFLIRCSSEKMMEEILVEGPWTVNGLTLHLLRWRPDFQACFAKLSTATLWVRLYNLPPEYWDANMLEPLAASLGKVVKVDVTTMVADRAKFARVCVDIDLTKPLERGIWISTPFTRLFIPILYEKLPLFCYRCGIVGHGADKCHMEAHRHRPEGPECDASSSTRMGKWENV
ncbi:hypothetical protein J5N97_023011 [Dioscorea zingiberensis]|uniref:CCHC-type domain-containing protein n=1 Tax=Dioscorea zingiberensis TaxID=325984 RepID=A0A9D5CC13_9LILI|nr:hypothetical protein J5N97_023011 [Dioscorea zingiberensis]